jgi:hypothetical protein
MKATRLGIGALGVIAMGYALWAGLRSPDIVPSHEAKFLLLLLVLHDGVLLPVFLVAGVLVHRFVPARGRAVVQAALIASASVTLVALPLTLGYGRIADSPSALPLDYGRGLLVTLSVIWAAALTATVTRHLLHRGRPDQVRRNRAARSSR